MAGVYQIYNEETGKRYIGSSIDVERRLKEHKRNLKAHRHSNQHLQNAWNKYQEYLVFEALEYCILTITILQIDSLDITLMLKLRQLVNIYLQKQDKN